jgi:hypothetical protein
MRRRRRGGQRSVCSAGSGEHLRDWTPETAADRSS